MPPLIYRLFVRAVVPLALIFAAVARPVCFSYFYLLMFFITPLLKISVRVAPLRRVTIFMIVLLVISCLFLLVQLITHIILMSNPSPPHCGNTEYLMQHVGLLSFIEMDFVDNVLWVLADIIVFNVSLITLIIARMRRRDILKISSIDDLHIPSEDEILLTNVNRRMIIYYIRIAIRTSSIFSLIALFLAGTLRPSIPGFIYFLIFIIAGTFWAFNKSLQKSFMYILMVVSVILVLHLLCIFTFQMPVTHKFVEENSLLARLVGLEVLTKIDCDSRRLVLNKDLNFDSFFNPIGLMIAYFVCVLSWRNRLRFGTYDQATYARQRSTISTVQQSEAKVSLIEQMFYILCDCTAFVYRHSYLLTNITMLSWSIIYHSWLTFALLICANVLWMIPNQRRPMMRSSLFLVFYAEFLLISQYIYSMDLKENELPTSSKESGINWEQIGFTRPQTVGNSPWEPLFVKSAFLVIFWITARQYCKEQGIGRSRDMLTDIFGSMHIRVNMEPRPVNRTPPLFRFISEMVSNFFTRLWTWLLCCLLFFCAMLENEMTVFRICYMALFLLFVMVFQMSNRVWLKFIYGYWLFVVFYAMFILTLIYTYQFDGFSIYFEKYLRLSLETQSDIGLRRFNTKELFLRLLIPTLTLIFTVIQLHYFHRHFILSILYPRMDEARRSTVNRISYDFRYDAPREKKSFLRKLVCFNTKKLRRQFRRSFRGFKNFTWRFLELHMIKAAYLAAFFCAASRIVFIHLPLVFFCIIGINMSRLLKTFCLRVILFLVAIYVLMIMIYQLRTYENSYFDKSCQMENSKNKTVNSAEWLGMFKRTTDKGLVQILAPYIIFFIVAFIQGVVKLRQKIFRKALGLHRRGKLKFLFSNVTRADAEKGFVPLMRFMFNYGYYKFGREITMIAIVICMSYRQDMICIVYTICLVVILLLSRMHCAKIWPIVTFIFSFSILAQFLVLLSFPPSTCWMPPWKLLKSISQNWNFLPKNLYKKCFSKLKMDYIVLMLITRQGKAFRAEVRNERHQIYPGGNNKNAVPDIMKLGHEIFNNPTHDFCSSVRNYADIVKVIIFCGFLWATISVVLLAGVCSMDLLSLGYLVFALMFLLKGSEVYLMNIRHILCRWNFLIAFNVFIIAVRASFSTYSFMLTVFVPDSDYMINFLLGINVVRSENDRQNAPFQYGSDTLLFSDPLYWHALVFAFIIIQKRIFTSYYICHVILDTNANHILASRGAVIIRNLRHTQNYERREHERRVLEKIKLKMERMRDFNQKTTQRMSRKKDIKLHPTVTRSGDYYMFEETEEVPDLNEIQYDYDFLEEETRSRRQNTKSTIKVEDDVKSKADTDSEIYLANSTSSEDDETIYQNPVTKLMTKFIVMLTTRLNRLSRNYRYVHKILFEEKKKLQEMGFATRSMMTNTSAMYDYLNTHRARNSILLQRRQSVETEFTTRDHNVMVKFFIALWYAIIANSELVCFLAVCLNQTVNSALISLPLPLVVFLWGSITLPRPSKTFWITLISYTLAMVFFKCIAHQRLQIFSDAMFKANSWEFQMFVKDGYATIDLLLLVTLFWHRYMLKKQGIWTTQTETIRTYQNLYKNEESFSNTSSIIKDTLRRSAGADDSRRQSVRTNTVIESDTSESSYSSDKSVQGYYKTIETREYIEGMKRLNQTTYCGRLRKFFFSLLHKVRLPTDIYAALFFCDFVNFFVLLFGYNSFVSRYISPTDVVFHAYLTEGKVPFSFLIMLLLQFLTIVIERAIYLRKALMVKLIFHFITVIVIHVWIFFIVPMVTGRSFGAPAPVIFYLIKCIHMLFSAYQIRRGYPTRVMGNFFTKSFSLVNLISFRVYMEIPFLYILRTLLDWVCIDTTLTLAEWLKMEDIYQSIFKVRCYRQLDSDFPVPRAVPKAFCSKCLLGGTILFLLVLIIWSPMLVFAIHSAFGKPNTPVKATLLLEIGQFGDIYNTRTNTGIEIFTPDDYNSLSHSFRNNAFAKEFLALYNHGDITSIHFDTSSGTMWTISPPDREGLLKVFEKGDPVAIYLTLVTERKSTPKDDPRKDSVQTKTIIDKRFPGRKKIISMLKNQTEDTVLIPDILPKFVVIRNQGSIDYKVVDYEDSYLRPLIISLKHDGSTVWWEVKDVCNDDYYETYLEDLPKSSCTKGVVIYAISDKQFPDLFKTLAIASMFGLYTTFIYFLSRMVRVCVANNHRRIMFEDLPFVDRVLKLCYDIYLVRGAREWRLEEELYAKLLFLYRSPETLIKWTRPIDENEENLVSSRSALSRQSIRPVSDNRDQRTEQGPEERPRGND